MSKRARKRQPTQPPPEWAELFSAHDDDLTRVRMLWRRGGGRYRPLVPVNLALEDLEALDFEEWEEMEMDETNFDWAVPMGEEPEESQRRCAELARELWGIAVLWTRAKGPVCDFQMRGYGGGEEILFEDGKRCNLSGEQSRYDDATERERPTVSDAVRQMINDERAAWMQMDRVKDGLINRLTDDREKLFKQLDRTTSAAPQLIENARDVLERAISFQQSHFADYMSRATGQRQLEAEAFKEYQRTKRAQEAFALVRDMGAAAFGALPTIRAAVMDITGNVGQALPKFQNAQQAMAWLHMTVQLEQLVQCFTGTETERVKTATEVLAMFDACSRAQDERVMLKQCEHIIKDLLATPVFAGVATQEQLLVAQYIIGRAAIQRVVWEHGE